MATVKGTSVAYGIASGASTGFTGAAAVTRIDGGNNSEKKRIKGNTGDSMSYIFSDPTIECTVEVVCSSTVVLPSDGDVIVLSGFEGGATAGASDLNGKYYAQNARLNHSNEDVITMTVELIQFNDTSAFSDLGA